jgi:chorismate mutase
MPATSAKKLLDIEMVESSGVDHAANGPQIGAEGWIVMKADGTKVGVVRAAKTPTQEAAKVPDEQTVEDLTKSVDELTAQVATLTKERDDAIAKAAEPPAADDGKDELQKALDANPLLKQAFEAQAAATKEATDKAAAAEEVAKSERNERLTREYIAKAKELGQPDTFAPMLREVVEKCSPEAAAEIQRIVKAAAEQAKAATVLTLPANAHVVVAGGSAWEQIVAKAAELRKADSTLSEPQSIEKARVENPDLVAAYRKEVAG